MVIAAGGATLLMNQSTVAAANQEKVSNLAAVSIKVVKGALSNIVTSAVAVGAVVASLNF